MVSALGDKTQACAEAYGIDVRRVSINAGHCPQAPLAFRCWTLPAPSLALTDGNLAHRHVVHVRLQDEAPEEVNEGLINFARTLGDRA